MTLRSHKFLLLPAALTLVGATARGQESFSPPLPDQGRFVSFEAASVFSPDTSKVFIDIHYRVNGAFFIFVRNSANLAKNEFIGRGEIYFELQSDQQASVAREVREIQISRSTLPQQGEPLTDEQGAVRLTVGEGTYHLFVEAKDLESGRTFSDHSTQVNAERPAQKRLNLSTAILYGSSSFDSVSHEPIYHTVNRGGAAVLGSSGGYIYQCYVPEDTAGLKCRWKITNENPEERHDDTSAFRGDDFTVENGILNLVKGEDGVSYRITHSPNEAMKILTVNLPLRRLETGRYSVDIDVTSGGTSATRRESLMVIWPNKPFSLSNFQLAVDALRYIATADETDEMNSFSGARSQAAFDRFWKARNPDTTTAFNAVMAEYYRRVDESIRRFSSPTEATGYKTDRGRIFILFGQPTSIQRVFHPDEPASEVWIYQGLKRKFVFTDTNKSGTYFLTSSENL